MPIDGADEVIAKTATTRRDGCDGIGGRIAPLDLDIRCLEQPPQQVDQNGLFLLQRLVQNPHVATIEIPLPNAELRERYIAAQVGKQTESLAGMTVDGLTQLSGGLNLVNLSVALTRSEDGGRQLDGARFRKLKKAMIERQCRGLLEFIEPRWTLDTVVGHEAAKARLREDAALLKRGALDSLPMGYLVCGPVGTGKSFLAQCVSGEIGAPCVVRHSSR